jgi:hypothetical protein
LELSQGVVKCLLDLFAITNTQPTTNNPKQPKTTFEWVVFSSMIKTTTTTIFITFAN